MSKVYLASSKPARMADVRAWIERDLAAMPLSETFDLVFVRAAKGAEFPAGAICTWEMRFGTELFRFYTTEARASEFLGEGYSLNALREAMEKEKRLWLDWAKGCVYQIVVESWSAEDRDWQLVDAIDGYYGAVEAIDTAEEVRINYQDFDLPEVDLVCCDDELAPELADVPGIE